MLRNIRFLQPGLYFEILSSEVSTARRMIRRKEFKKKKFVIEDYCPGKSVCIRTR